MSYRELITGGLLALSIRSTRFLVFGLKRGEEEESGFGMMITSRSIDVVDFDKRVLCRVVSIRRHSTNTYLSPAHRIHRRLGRQSIASISVFLHATIQKNTTTTRQGGTYPFRPHTHTALMSAPFAKMNLRSCIWMQNRWSTSATVLIPGGGSS
jgi:hypothetical protein